MATPPESAVMAELSSAVSDEIAGGVDTLLPAPICGPRLGLDDVDGHRTGAGEGDAAGLLLLGDWTSRC